MLHFASEVSSLVHQLGTLDDIAVKVASPDQSYLAQYSVKQGSSLLYDVIVKEALHRSGPQETNHAPVVDFVKKMAHVLGKKVPDDVLQTKLAATVVIDDALTNLIRQESDGTKQAELRETQEFGREFFAELLRKII